MPIGLEQVKTEMELRLIDVAEVAKLCNCSIRSVHRMAGIQLPPAVKLRHLIRWPLRTGNPTTGILDWLENGCPSCAQAGGQR